MNFTWELPPESIPISDALLEATGHRPVLARLLSMRGFADPEEVRRFLDPDLYRPAPASMLHDLVKGADRIEKAIQLQEAILVWGDFDVDGQTSTALLVSALERLGADVDYHIPIRAQESHGIRPEFLQPYLDKGIDILVSCDTGIVANDAVDLANTYSVDVVITDHHDLPAVLPAAFATIDPKFHEPDHPLYALPGVGVAYKLIEELFQRVGRASELEAFLDLVAMGIVADIAQQTKDTRYLLQRGLSVLRNTERVGLHAIMKLGKVKASQLIDEDIGFQIGPRLNAVGRLGDANVSVPLLTTSDTSLAATIADELEDLNRDRRYMTANVYDSARAQVDRDPSMLQYAALVLANPEWHQGVIGIVASRLVEEFGKPTILLASPVGEPARGSARSIEGYHITEAITTQADYLLGFGGHPMAAGMAMAAKDIDRFRRGVSKAIVDQRKGKAPVATLNISLEINLNELNLELAEEVELMAPFGAGNPPVNYLCRNVVVADDVNFGQDQAHRKLHISDGQCEPVEVLWWGGAGEPVPAGELDLVFHMRPGYFMGRRTLRITLLDLQRADRLRKEAGGLPYEVKDYRHVSDPEALLTQLKSEYPTLQIWGEMGLGNDGIKHRIQLEPTCKLVVWTLPPNGATLAAVINHINPEVVFFFGNDPGMDAPQAFFKRLVGLSKYTCSKYEGKTTMRALAAACAQTTTTIKIGLGLLPRLGMSVDVDGEGGVSLGKAEKVADAGNDVALARVLKESAAFRRALVSAQELEEFLG